MIKLILTTLVSNVLNCVSTISLMTIQLIFFKAASGIRLPVGLFAIRSDTHAANICESFLLVSIAESGVICGYFAASFCYEKPFVAGLLSSIMWVIIFQIVPPQGIGSHLMPLVVATFYYSVVPLGLLGAYIKIRFQRAQRGA